MPTDHQLLKSNLDELTSGLFPFVEAEMRSIYHDRWIDAARESFRDERGAAPSPRGAMRWDAHALLTVMWDQWNRVFKYKLAPPDRSLLSELRDFRNRWAHQDRFSFDDAYRFLDSIERLLKAVDAGEQAARVARDKRELLREEINGEIRAIQQHSRERRKRRQDLLLYGACCGSLVYTVFHAFGAHAWILAMGIVFAFAYLIYTRLTFTQPISFGARECPMCSKIIYGEGCPYCGPSRTETVLTTHHTHEARKTPPVETVVTSGV